jgi:hypothetical protein
MFRKSVDQFFPHQLQFFSLTFLIVKSHGPPIIKNYFKKLILKKQKNRPLAWLKSDFLRGFSTFKSKKKSSSKSPNSIKLKSRKSKFSINYSNEMFYPF